MIRSFFLYLFYFLISKRESNCSLNSETYFAFFFVIINLTLSEYNYVVMMMMTMMMIIKITVSHTHICPHVHLNNNYIVTVIHFISFIRVLSTIKSRKNEGSFFPCAHYEGTGGSGVINPPILHFGTRWR
jgi:hypothetical protein